MNRFIIFLICIIFLNGCSLNKNSKFWTSSQDIQKEKNLNYKEVFVKEEALGQELNTNISINLGKIINNNIVIFLLL